MQLTSTTVTRPDLRSFSNTSPNLRTKFGERAFSFAGNSLPAELRPVSYSTVFTSKLKSHVFNNAFNVQ